MARTRTIDLPKGPMKWAIINGGDMKRIEEAIGYEISSDQWTKINAATAIMTFLISGNRTAAPLPMVLKKITELRRAALSLRDEFPPEIVSPYDGNDFQKTYKRYFGNATATTPPYASSIFLADLLEFVIAITEFFGRDWASEKEDELGGSYGSFSLTEIWEFWIKRITEIMKEANLPYKVRKDTDKQKGETPSAFVILIRELQKSLPAEFRMFIHSDDSLAQAIHRARRRRSI